MPPSVLAVAAVALIVAGVAAVLMAGRTSGLRQQARLAQMRGQRHKAAVAVEREEGLTRDRAPFITKVIAGTPLWDDLQMQALRAGWLLRPSELIAMMVMAGAVAFAIGAVAMRNIWGGAALLPVGFIIPYALMKTQQTRRQKALSAQLPDALDMLSSALRAGFAFMRGLQLVGTQMHAPISDEMRRIVDEVQFGIGIDEGLDNLVTRTGNYDLELVAAAVQTQLQLGGNLSEVLENISGTIRERVRLAGELSAATAEGRLSAGILIAMPFAMAILVNIMNPGYMAPMVQSTLGFGLIALALVMMVVGALVIRKLINVEI